MISLSGNTTPVRTGLPPSLCAVQRPTAKRHCLFRASQNTDIVLCKEYEHMMQHMQNSSGTELHPAQKADLWGERTG